MDPFSEYGQIRYSHDYGTAQEHSTPYDGGGSGRSTELPQASSQALHRSSSVGTSFEPQPDTGQFNCMQMPLWNDNFGFPQVEDSQPHRFSANPVDPNDLRTFSRPANEEPWSGFNGPLVHNDALSFYPTTCGSRAHTIAEAVISPEFPRSFELSRELSTISPDSGFESIRPTNLGEISLIEQAYITEPSNPARVVWDAPPPRPTSVRSEPRDTLKRRRTKAQVPPCMLCRKEFKNQSDAKKHALKHSKPYVCGEPDCSRKEGFATKNDLERHRKGVHGQEPSVGKATGYICQACLADNSATATKWWPRLDNFKAHIKRRHPNWSESNLIESSEAARPPGAPSESGYASQAPPSLAPDDQTYQDGTSHSIDVNPGRSASQVGGMALFNLVPGQFDPLASVGEGPGTDSFLGPVQHHPASHLIKNGRGSLPSGLSMLTDAAFRVASPVASAEHLSGNSGRNVPGMYAQQTGLNGNAPVFKQVQWDDSASQLPEPNGVPKHRASTGSQEDLSMYRTTAGKYQCPAPGCEKVKNRECDLRKHLKRHSRPYGCTFPNCYKKFGSRNDWKRHENSQHRLNDMWRCEVEHDGRKCGKVYGIEHDFVMHLQRKHGMHANSEELAQCAKDMHLGREGYNRFWCGFCNALINPADSEPRDGIQRSAWVVRFRHIGDHLDKNCHIGSWVCIQYNKPKGILTKEEKRKERSRFKSERADDSDLPDDGIPVDVPRKMYAASDLAAESPSKRRKLGNADFDADGVSDCEF